MPTQPFSLKLQLTRLLQTSKSSFTFLWIIIWVLLKTPTVSAQQDVCFDAPCTNLNTHTPPISNPNDVEGVMVTLTATSCPGTCNVDETTTGQTVTYGFCSPCPNCVFTLRPKLDILPMNGISTFDLLLISKHILGIQAIDSPYKMIAADVNKSNSISTFDIVELRKLILGIYSELPDNDSWRFIDKNFIFPVPQNAFETQFPEEISNITPPADNADFVAIKIGDINLSSVNHNRPAPRPTTDIQVPYVAANRDGIITVPLVYTGVENLEAIQFALRFDPANWQLIGPSKGDLPAYTADNFGLTQVSDGIIRTLWVPWVETPRHIAAGTTLFYLSFKALNRNAENSIGLLQLENGNLECMGWNLDGQEFQLKLGDAAEQRTTPESLSPSTVKVEIAPNPTTGAVAVTIRNAPSGKAYLALFGTFGDRVALHKFDVAPDGTSQFVLDDTRPLPAGIYSWELHAGRERLAGTVVKQ